MKELFNKYKLYILTTVALIVVVSVYFSENLQGKKLQESDIVQHLNVASEVYKYKEEGRAFKKKEDMHRMAEANKAFAFFKF
jgi:ribosomal protein S7